MAYRLASSHKQLFSRLSVQRWLLSDCEEDRSLFQSIGFTAVGAALITLSSSFLSYYLLIRILHIPLFAYLVWTVYMIYTRDIIFEFANFELKLSDESFRFLLYPLFLHTLNLSFFTE